MKKTVFILLIFAVIVLTSLSCNKVLGKTCWECEVQKFSSSETYTEKVCRDDDLVPQFTDANGNDLNAICHKK